MRSHEFSLRSVKVCSNLHGEVEALTGIGGDLNQQDLEHGGRRRPDARARDQEGEHNEKIDVEEACASLGSRDGPGNRRPWREGTGNLRRAWLA